jgi:hypothetical protein
MVHTFSTLLVALLQMPPLLLVFLVRWFIEYPHGFDGPLAQVFIFIICTNHVPQTFVVAIKPDEVISVVLSPFHFRRALVGKPEGRRPLGRPRRRWEDNIKVDLREVGWGGMDWINVAQDRDRWRALVNAVMNLRVP